MTLQRNVMNKMRALVGLAVVVALTAPGLHAQARAPADAKYPKV